MVSSGLRRRRPRSVLVLALVFANVAAGPTIAEAAAPSWYANSGRITNEAGVRVDGVAREGLVLTSSVIGEVACTKAILSGTTDAIGGSGGFIAGGCTATQLHTPVLVTAALPPEPGAIMGEVCKAENKTPADCPATEEREWVAVVPVSNAPDGSYQEFPQRADAAWTQRLSYGEWDEEPTVLDQIGNAAQPASETCTPASERWREVADGCIKLNIVVPNMGIEDVVYGSLTGGYLDGVQNGLSPSRIELNRPGSPLGSSGLLESNENSLGEVSVRAEVSVRGEAGMELITTH